MVMLFTLSLTPSTTWTRAVSTPSMRESVSASSCERA